MKTSTRHDVRSAAEAPAPGAVATPHRAMPRRVEPEILDSLPPDDREAQRSRRDLRLINAVMRNQSWFRRTLPGLLRSEDRVLELGPGDSRLREVAPRSAAWDGIDRAPRPMAWPASARWHREDILTFSGWSDYTVIVANLVLHHFSDGELHAIGAQIARHARLVAACEPVRRRHVQRVFALFCRCIGASPVTRHDGDVSITAGFLDDELPTLLGLSRSEWEWRARPGGLGAYRLLAQRRP